MYLWMFEHLTSDTQADDDAACTSLNNDLDISGLAGPSETPPSQVDKATIDCADARMANDERNIAENSQTRGFSASELVSRRLALDQRGEAATMIQRNYRGYRARRQMKGIGMSPATRWSEAIKDLRFREWTRPTSRQDNHALSDEHARARKNWQRIGAIASRACADDSDDEPSEIEDSMSPEEIEEHRKRKRAAKAEREKTAKQMDLQYWLEMVDDKHRYGSNLRAYHQEWLKTDTHENFFYWLDHGDGKNIEVPLVTRARLDFEQVRYLSREERQNYLVTIDKQGRLCWAHNGMRITTSTAYKDSVDGIVPNDDTEHKPWALPLEGPGEFSSDEESNISAGQVNEPEAEHYVNTELKKSRGLNKIKHVSAAAILNHLLQKSVRPNSWIFVADTSFRLYVGIKQSGAFQHSSFLHGSRISAAGLIQIKDGQLRKLSPLSGHYRPPTQNFRQFVHSLKDAGVDMSHVSISRSYAILVGLEMYTRTRKKFKHGVHHAEKEKEKMLHPEEVKKLEEAQKDKSKSAEKERQILESQQHKEAESKRRNSISHRVISKIWSKASTSSAGKTSESAQSS